LTAAGEAHRAATVILIHVRNSFSASAWRTQNRRNVEILMILIHDFTISEVSVICQDFTAGNSASTAP
jgi:hypothetical protein